MIQTADLMDKYPHLQVATPIFQNFGRKQAFCGVIRTIKCFEDNSYVREILNQEGKNQVLVIDGGGSLNCALLGDQLAELVIKNHWQGVIINGCIRDSQMINGLDIGVKAIATNPRKSIKNNQGQINVVLNFAAVKFKPNEYLYADLDGIVLAKKELD